MPGRGAAGQNSATSLAAALALFRSRLNGSVIAVAEGGLIEDHGQRSFRAAGGTHLFIIRNESECKVYCCV